jgi:hypothetical protein
MRYLTRWLRDWEDSNMDALMGAGTTPAGAVGMVVTRDLGVLKQRKAEAWRWRVKNWVAHRWLQDLQMVLVRLVARVTSLVYFESRLFLKVLHADGTVTDLGLVGRRVVTTAGVGYIVDAFQNLVELENMKYHGFGTGTGAESSSDTALGTELTTEYVTNGTRPTGTTAEGASANIFQSVATLSPDSGTPAVTEHGLFSASSSGVLLDRTKFTAVNLDSTSSLQATYELTLTAGS